MSRIFMFPGQGSQKVGMGAGLFERFPELTAQADAELGYSIAELCLTNSQNLLDNTAYTQPALYVVSALTYLAKQQDEPAVVPDFAVGHSLGEYTALYAAGVFDFITGLKLVKRRGALMSEATGGGMAAVLGIPPETISATLADGFNTIDMANFNTPAQTVISGPAEAIQLVKEPMEKAGAMKVVILNVSGAFHSRYMAPSAEAFAKYLTEFTFSAPRIPVIANATAQPYAGTTEDTISNLTKQIFSPVRWVETIELLLQKPDPAFDEVGPGSVLAGMHRQITRAKKR
ncbi:MAG TPA: ACP S-malonyltransferase [Candidatus Methylacidiphilales bacterium]|nr:ACP S-malonyltransferase [Candidatus Methylacidiphilales bacterium]